MPALLPAPVMAAVSDVRINEVESNGGTPGDWVEFYNSGATPADVSGLKFLDNDDTHAPYSIPAGTVIPAGGYLVLDEAQFGFGLGGADSARLFLADGVTLVDSYAWTAHAAITYGRCPSGTGAFASTTASTKGAANSCAGEVTASPWPGNAAVATADGVGVFGGNMSGLAYEPSGTAATGVLWASKNGPGTLYRLVWDGTNWVPDTANNWGAGKVLHYPNGTGDPDAEGVTFTSAGSAGGVYIATERNNAASGVSRLS
ncbi:MAG: lamin tail domain-containing protein, partial [Dehalococcoidia bacterium]